MRQLILKDQWLNEIIMQCYAHLIQTYGAMAGVTTREVHKNRKCIHLDNKIAPSYGLRTSNPSQFVSNFALDATESRVSEGHFCLKNFHTFEVQQRHTAPQQKAPGLELFQQHCLNLYYAAVYIL